MIRLLPLLILLAISCNSCSQNGQSYANSKGFQYNLESPTKIIKLPDELVEISGISYTADNTILCIQDEVGIIFNYNPQTEKIEKKIQFAEKGDFEELAVVNNNTYVLESNGDIYSIENYKSDNFKQQKFETPLKQKNDSEGLCYDMDNNRLLVTNKESGKKKQSENYIYSFDLKNQQLSNRPAITIDIIEVKKYLEQNKEESFFESILSSFDDKNPEKLFKPSALAIHPITKELYILSANNKLLLVINHSGKIQNVLPLKHETFNQPEGITFAPNGDMFISNEGRRNKIEGNILMFSYVK